jgi:hypothetical protein
MRVRASALLATALLLSATAFGEGIRDGQTPPPLAGSTWIGTPVSLDAVKGNAVFLAFWNYDAPC